MRIVFFLYLFYLPISSVNGQTCCTGGVTTIGIFTIPDPNSDGELFLNAEFNNISSTILNDEVLDESTTNRYIQTYALQLAYPASEYITFSVVIPYLIQNQSTRTDILNNNGFADLSVWLSAYLLEDKEWKININSGVKLPTGDKSQQDPITNLNFPASFQNGTGAFDFLFYPRLDYRLSGNFSAGINGFVKITTSAETAGIEHYKFGNSYAGGIDFSKEWVTGNYLLSFFTGGLIQYQQEDQIKEWENPNTGGIFSYWLAGINFKLSPAFSMSGQYTLPLYQNVNGLQIATSSRMNFKIIAKRI
ncbi:MAG: hypothetical protein ACNS60_20010 [Candidatus Cyclobacteriaceae bacterium M2_1C_046]